MDELYKQGAYWCEVTDYGLTKSRGGKQSDQTRVRFLVKGPVNSDDPETFDEADVEFERTFFQVISPKTVQAGMVQQVFDALGFSGTFAEFDEDEACRGTYVKMYCKHEVYKGQTVERWQISKGELQRLSSDETGRLDAMFGSHMVKTAPAVAKETKPVVTSPAAKGTPVPSASSIKGADDIPF